MKIKIALIPHKHINEAQSLSVKLLNSMASGEMSDVDLVTEELVSLIDSDYSLSLSEEYWRQLVENIRDFDNDFKSDCLIEKTQLETIISSGLTEPFTDVVSIVERAVQTDGVVLQLPFEEE